MSFSTFIVTGDYAALAPGSVVNGSVTFTPNLGPGYVAHAFDSGNIGFIRGMAHAAIINGVLTPTSSFAANVTLYSSDPDLHLNGPLQYTVDFENVTVDGVPAAVDSFVFNAPSDSTPVDLIGVTPGYPLQITPFSYITSSQISDSTQFGRSVLTGDATVIAAAVAPGFHAATSKTTPVDADEIPLIDSAASFALKKLTWANLKATIAAYYNTLAATMTNKTLTNPKINAIKDTNGTDILQLDAVGSAVNRLGIVNNVTGNIPYVYALGSDTNITMGFAPKGTGTLTLWDGNFRTVFATAAGVASAVNYVYAANSAAGNASSIGAFGSDTNVGLDLATKGTGVVTANSVPVVTTTGVQTPTNKNLTSGTNTFPTFNQNTTGSAANLTTPRAINGVNFDGTAAITVVDSAAVPKSTVTTKGDLIVGTGSATVARLAAGSNGQVDVDDSTASTGRAKVYPRPLSFNLPSIGGSTANSAAQNDTAFTAALAAMGNYGELHIPPGTYDFNGITYPNVGSITVRGSGRNKTFLRNNHATNSSVKFDGTGATGGNIFGPGCELSDLALTATALRTSQIGVDSRLAVTFSVERLHIESIGIAAQVQKSWAGAYRDIDVLTCDVGLIIGSTPAATPLVIDNFNVYNCRRGGWIKGTAGDSIKFINGGFTNNTENGMVIDSFARNVNFDTVVFENNTLDDVIIGNVSPAEGPFTVVFDTCAFLADTLHKTRSIHYIQGTNLAFRDCSWQGFSGGHYDLLILQDGTAAQLVIDNPSYDASNQILLTKWDGNHQLLQGGTRLESHGFLVGGVSRSGNGISRLPSVFLTVASATPAINTDLADVFNIPVTAAITSMTTGLTGTAYDGQEMTIRFRADGTGRAVTHGAKFSGTLLTTTVASKIHTAKYVYDGTSTKWECTAVNTAGV